MNSGTVEQWNSGPVGGTVVQPVLRADVSMHRIREWVSSRLAWGCGGCGGCGGCAGWGCHAPVMGGVSSHPPATDHRQPHPCNPQAGVIYPLAGIKRVVNNRPPISGDHAKRAVHVGRAFAAACCTAWSGRTGAVQRDGTIHPAQGRDGAAEVSSWVVAGVPHVRAVGDCKAVRGERFHRRRRCTAGHLTKAEMYV